MKKRAFILPPAMLAFVALVIVGCSISREVEATTDVSAEPPDNSSGLTPDATTEYITISGRRISITETSLSIVIEEDEKPRTETGLVIYATSKTLNAEIVQLKYMTNLQVLNISNYEDAGSDFSDISALAGLINLTELNLIGNKISDITPLSNLTNLTVLSLRNNQIVDITPLSGLTNLVWLWLDNNQISDITPLSDHTRLNVLVLSSNQISDVTPFSGLDMHLGFLYLANNQISDITPLSGLRGVDELYLSNNPITDWSPVEHIWSVDGRP